MKAQLYHTPSFHLHERRYARPDYARAFRLWYDRHRHEWWLPALTPADLRLISAWEQRRCDRSHINRAIHTSSEPLADDPSRHLAILYLHFLNSKILPQYGDIAILCANPRDTKVFCRSIGMDLRRVHVRSHRNPWCLLGMTCDTALILDADRSVMRLHAGLADDIFFQELRLILPWMDFSPLCYFIIHGGTDNRQGVHPNCRRRSRFNRTHSFHRFLQELHTRPAADNPYLLTDPMVVAIDTPPVGMHHGASSFTDIYLRHAVGTPRVVSALTDPSDLNDPGVFISHLNGIFPLPRARPA